MIDWKLIGDLFICFSILLGGFTFAYVNANYVPDPEDHHERNQDEER